MNFYEQEMRKLFDCSQVIYDQKYCGKTCIGKLDSELRVKLEFVSCDISSQYNAIQISIINRTEGIIDKHIFHFNDIIGVKYNDNPNFHNGVHPHIWDDDGKPKWYIYKPMSSDYQAISDTITGYLSLFQDERMELTEPSM